MASELKYNNFRTKIILKISSEKLRTFRLGLSVLNGFRCDDAESREINVNINIWRLHVIQTQTLHEHQIETFKSWFRTNTGSLCISFPFPLY